jgi:hypothetical protein
MMASGERSERVSTKLARSRRRLAHATQPVAHGYPALSPARVRSCRVLLGQRASLHSLRLGLTPPGPAFVVRLFHWYYPVVRLLDGVRVGRTALAFAHRSALVADRHRRGLPVLVQKVSRRAWGLPTAQDRTGTRVVAPNRVAFRFGSQRRRPGGVISRLNTQPVGASVQRFTRDVATAGA